MIFLPRIMMTKRLPRPAKGEAVRGLILKLILCKNQPFHENKNVSEGPTFPLLVPTFWNKFPSVGNEDDIVFIWKITSHFVRT